MSNGVMALHNDCALVQFEFRTFRKGDFETMEIAVDTA